jgi:predicted carbohydrate-binding protein with CBM5 and CBM33 domain
MQGSFVRRLRHPGRTLAMAISAFLVLAALLALVAVRSDDASAHGTVTDPPTRSYSCWSRWPNGVWTDPAMQQKDPMCWQAYSESPAAMWNWNGQLRDNLGAANYTNPAVIPDGKICSGGLAEGGRYAPLDKPGKWKTVDKPNSFPVTFRDDAKHGGWYQTYVTRQGFNVETDVLKWSDLEDRGRTRDYARDEPVSYNVTAPGRSGPHIVLTLWKAGHADQMYYLCSDVNFTGAGGTPTPTSAPRTTTPATTAPSTPSTGPTPTTTPTPTGPPAGDGTCTATYKQVSGWAQGFQGEITVTAGATALKGWSVNATFPGGQSVNQAWNSTVTSSGGINTFANAAWNGNVAAGSSQSLGFLASGSGAAPTLTCSAR